MISFSEYRNIADKILSSLGISDDIYLSWDRNSMREFAKQYIYNTDYVDALVDIELANYDTSDMHPSAIADLRIAAIDEICERLGALQDNYYAKQDEIRDDAYASIISTLKNSNLDNVTDIDVEYEPSDPEVGIYNEERRIVFTLSNDMSITFEVTFED